MLDSLSSVVGDRVVENSLEVLFRIEPKVPTYLSGDSLRITQILTHLLSNAIKFTPPDFAWDLNKKDEVDIDTRPHDIDNCHNFWWLGLGGENASIHDKESLRDDNVTLGVGIWDQRKNHGKE